MHGQNHTKFKITPKVPLLIPSHTAQTAHQWLPTIRSLQYLPYWNRQLVLETFLSDEYLKIRV